MKWYRADLHIHSVLSPCGDLDMSPANIISEAKKQKLEIIGIADHNSTLHAELLIKLGNENGITVFPGAEVNTKEEVHCLVFFENIEATKLFQEYLDKYLLNIPNQPKRFGHQLVVNELEEILTDIPQLLIMGLDQTIEQVEKKAHQLNGVFIPAHIDKSVNSIFSQIGFLPNDLKIDALEISGNSSLDTIISSRKELNNYTIISNSDAHLIEQIGTSVSEYRMETPDFNEWKMALKGTKGRRVKTA